MSYALDPDESLPAGLRRIADEQVGEALDSLASAADAREKADAGIHDARKRFKKVRAVLRLVRKELGSDRYGRENEAYRDAGRLLSDVRESSVLPNTVTALLERHDHLLERDPFEDFVQHLGSRHAATLDEARLDGGALERATAAAEAARDRIPEWPIPDGGFDVVAASLRKVYRRGRNRMTEAWDDPTGPRFHEWRKRAKYLWYHLRILAPAWPAVMEPWGDAQHDLTDLLGKGNDMTDLLEILDREPDLLPQVGVVEVLRGLAEAHRRELWVAARPLGRRLYSEAPRAFVERLGGYMDGTPPA
jgi:CHAD domain-containing protein